ncbi:MAG: NUDIX domain-containing protein [Solirubrobacteraceae bacterium]
MAEILRRPAARVVCFDPGGRILLMNWRDPVSGRSILEPPGGGIEPGESAIEAARREWTEEIGRSVSLREDWAVDCEREIEWAGRRIQAIERFFGAATPDTFEPDPSGFTSSEVVTYLGAHWVSSAGLALPDALAGDLEPPDLAALVKTLAAMRGPEPDQS